MTAYWQPRASSQKLSSGHEESSVQWPRIVFRFSFFTKYDFKLLYFLAWITSQKRNTKACKGPFFVYLNTGLFLQSAQEPTEAQRTMEQKLRATSEVPI